MKSLVLYCKSYRTDLRRIRRLAETVRRYNTESLPFYVSAPKADMALFGEHLQDLNVHLLADEEIIAASPRIDSTQFDLLPGRISQQVVKSEFWRLGTSEAYVCLDSDALFIRPFGKSDFMAPNGTPYTMMDEAHDLLEDAMHQKRERIVEAYNGEADLVQQMFGRLGRRYSFGPFPLVWHRAVWQSLEKHYFVPNAMSFVDAIARAPIESRWYGEALLAYQAIPLLPCQALFKVYHYAWQFDRDRRAGMHIDQLSKLYIGVIYQSAWERDLDWPAEGGNLFSRVGRNLRRRFGRM
jgi:hypothetical protein